MIEITKRIVDKSPFNGSYVELTARVNARVRVDEKSIDPNGYALNAAAERCYRLLIDQMDGFNVIDNCESDIGDARSRHGFISVAEKRTPDSRDLFIGYEAKCERCGARALRDTPKEAYEAIEEMECRMI